MEIFLTYVLPYLVTLIVAVITGFITYSTAIKQSKLESIKQREQFILDNSSHIKKLHYEEKFKIYRNLSESFLTAIMDNSQLFPIGIDKVPQNEEEQYNFYLKRYENACKSIDKATYVLHSNAPFIDKDIFEKFSAIHQLCKRQIVYYPMFVLDKYSYQNELRDEQTACWSRTSDILSKREELMDFLRQKINSDEAPA